MEAQDLLKLEERLNAAKDAWKYLDRYHQIVTGKVEYTNEDIDELLLYYTQREKYEVCDRLIKLKKI